MQAGIFAVAFASIASAVFVAEITYGAPPVAPAALVGGGDFDECGTMVQGPVCLYFRADSGLEYFIDTTGGFGPGDRLRVVGSVFLNNCVPPGCSTNFTGCVTGNAALSCDAGLPFCFGDGGNQVGCTPCPCGNEAPQGTIGGCLNGASQSARLEATGNAAVSNDTFRLEMIGGNPATFGVLASADNQLPNMGPCAPGSGIFVTNLDGLRCIGGNLLRHGSRATDAQGDIGITSPGWGTPNGPPGGIIAQGGFSAGQTRSFQVFYREDDQLGCGQGQNTSNGVLITFAP